MFPLALKPKSVSWESVSLSYSRTQNLSWPLGLLFSLEAALKKGKEEGSADSQPFSQILALSLSCKC